MHEVSTYYTGTIYETTLDDYPRLVSVCSGGRYDDLASHYINKKLPGVGVSIGLTRLFSQLVEQGIVKPQKKSIAEVLIVPLTDDQFKSALNWPTSRENLVMKHDIPLGTSEIFGVDLPSY